MRLLVVLHESFGANGGIARFNQDLLGALAAWPQIERVTVLQRDPPGPAPLPERVEVLAGGGRRGLALALLRLLASGLRPDAVICGHLYLLPLAWLAARRFGAPLALMVYGIDAWQPSRRRLADLLVRRVDRVFSISELTLKRLAGWSGVATDRGRLLPPCVDLERFSPGPADPAAAASHGVAGRRVVMTLGRFPDDGREKGVDELLEVLPRLRERRPDLVYLVAGDGADRPRLTAKAESLGLRNAVVFTGFVSEEEKPALYRLADAFVLCGHGEGFGIVLLEAMASGVPAVASCRDASREAVLDGRLGVVADPERPDSLVAAVEAALERPKGVRPEGLESFACPAFAERLRRLVTELAGLRSRRGGGRR